MKKNIAVLMAFLFISASFFAQSAEFSAHMKKAKEYESGKKWTFALGEYYDAIGTDDEFKVKDAAYEAYNALANTILDGNPGYGTYNDFTVHDAWKTLLMDAEQYGSSWGIYELRVGKLKKVGLNYETRTANYKAPIMWNLSYKYMKTIEVIRWGYEKAYKNDWSDLPAPEDWPYSSVSAKGDGKFDVNGALVFEIRTAREDSKSDYKNAFACAIPVIQDFYGLYLYDYKFNIIDENGNEIAKPKRYLMGTGYNNDFNIRGYEMSFSEVSSDAMDLIDNGKAKLNVVGLYLEYGKYNAADDKGGYNTRGFIKNLPEKALPIDKRLIHIGNYDDKAKYYFIHKEIPMEGNFIITAFKEDNGKYSNREYYELTGKLREIVLGGAINPRSGYRAFSQDHLVLCNTLSGIFGLKPAYGSDNGYITDIVDSRWQLTNAENGYSLDERYVIVLEESDGFRIAGNPDSFNRYYSNLYSLEEFDTAMNAFVNEDFSIGGSPKHFIMSSKSVDDYFDLKKKRLENSQ